MLIKAQSQFDDKNVDIIITFFFGQCFESLIENIYKYCIVSTP